MIMDTTIFHNKVSFITFSLNILKHYSKFSDSTRTIYIAGYYDYDYGHDYTLFEFKSDHIEIGVIARSDEEANVLLKILQTIIDKSIVLFKDTYVLSVHDGNDEEEFIKKLKQGNKKLKQENNYLAKCDENEEVIANDLLNKCMFYGSTLIEKPMKYVDLWDINRITKYLLTQFANDEIYGLE